MHCHPFKYKYIHRIMKVDTSIYMLEKVKIQIDGILDTCAQCLEYNVLSAMVQVLSV